MPNSFANLTGSQLTTLKTDVLANFNGVSDEATAAAYNLPASPDYYVWRTNVTEDEFVGTAGVDVANGGASTNWSWVGTGFITRSAGEIAAWGRIFVKGACNPSLANVRQAFTDILSGATSPAPANRNHLTVLAKRKATRGEKLFATGNGAFATPSTMAVEGTVTPQNIAEARG